jgi:carbon monoxide dehydrogenase subunit G
MEKINRTAFVVAPAAKIFGYLMNARNLPEILPNMLDVSNIQTKTDGMTESNDFTYKMGGVKVHGHIKFTDVERDRRIVWNFKGGIESTTRWTLAPHGNGTDILDEVDYELPKRLLTRLAAPLLRRFSEHEADTCLRNLKACMETAW